MLKPLIAVLAMTSLVACAGEGQRRGEASPEEVARAAYHDPGPPSLTLYTVVSNATGSGGHTALMVNASQRVIFDPAGSFHHEDIPRRGDVLYGITPAFEQGYRSMHARAAYHVVSQTVEVAPETAAKALALVTQYGAVPQTQCASATSEILRQLPGFQSVSQTMYPVTLEKSFAQITGVEGQKYYEDYTPPGTLSASGG